MKKKLLLPILLILIMLPVIVCIVGYSVLGVYSIPPIGLIPDGVTLVIVRAGTDLQFIDSPDSMSMRIYGETGTFFRWASLDTYVSYDVPIITKIRFNKQLYLISTGGEDYTQ